MRLLREELTGAPPPQSLSMVMDLWRPWVESRAGELFRERRPLEDQATFVEISRRLIGALETDLGDASNDQDDSKDDSDSPRTMVTAERDSRRAVIRRRGPVGRR